jgi:hypothetical protein
MAEDPCLSRPRSSRPGHSASQETTSVALPAGSQASAEAAPGGGGQWSRSTQTSTACGDPGWPRAYPTRRAAPVEPAGAQDETAARKSGAGARPINIRGRVCHSSLPF